MANQRLPVTPAIRLLRAAGVAFSDHPYAYEEHGGTAVSSRELGVDEHAVINPSLTSHPHILGFWGRAQS